MKSRNTFIYNTVFMLLCLSNILNIFMDRGQVRLNEEAGGSRIIIQLVNVSILGIMLINTLNFKYPSPFKWIKIFFIMLIVYSAIYILNPINGNFNTNNYFRLSTNLIGFLFFFSASLQMNERKLRKYMHVYIITLMISATVKIFSSSFFSADTLGAGDTASIALVFLIPLIFIFFDLKHASILYMIAFVITVISLRRTCIIAFILSVPFLYAYIKPYVKVIHSIIALAVVAFLGFYLWQYFGGFVVTRFMEMTDKSNDSYGSGRSLFYMVLINDYLNNPNSYIFGNGLVSVWHFFQLKGFNYLPHAHNDFLEIIYTFGFFGFYIWISFLVSLFKEKWNYPSLHSIKRFYYMAISLYLVVALASGTILRIEMLPFVMSISFLLASKRRIINENILLLQRIKYANVLVAENAPV